MESQSQDKALSSPDTLTLILPLLRKRDCSVQHEEVLNAMVLNFFTKSVIHIVRHLSHVSDQCYWRCCSTDCIACDNGEDYHCLGSTNNRTKQACSRPCLQSTMMSCVFDVQSMYCFQLFAEIGAGRIHMGQVLVCSVVCEVCLSVSPSV